MLDYSPTSFSDDEISAASTDGADTTPIDRRRPGPVFCGCKQGGRHWAPSLMMAGINGIDLLGRLRKGRITAPAIFITVVGYIADLRAAVARTGAEVLIKPFKPEELIAPTKNALDCAPN